MVRYKEVIVGTEFGADAPRVVSYTDFLVVYSFFCICIK